MSLFISLCFSTNLFACPEHQYSTNEKIIRRIKSDPRYFIDYIIKSYGKMIKQRLNKKNKLTYEKNVQPDYYVRPDGVEIIVR